MRSLKYFKNITESVKLESVIQKSRELGVVIEEYTIHELRAAGVDVPDEREFYREYIIKRNCEIANERMNVSQELLDNNTELETIRQRQRWLVDTYNL
jgi:hypothetical protein